LPRALANALGFRHLTKTSLADFVKEGLAMRKSRELTWSQLAMAANAPMLTRASMVDGKLEVGILPTGQVVGVIEALPTVAEVLETLMREAEATLARLTGIDEAPRLARPASPDAAASPRRERA
jgi:NAD(P)H-dependent flavin oxidoreductase YrpB (nitropropane dioxygenase family)